MRVSRGKHLLIDGLVRYIDRSQKLPAQTKTKSPFPGWGKGCEKEEGKL
jgi:hypothetical protein